jgi:hypothetical protein
VQIQIGNSVKVTIRGLKNVNYCIEYDISDEISSVADVNFFKEEKPTDGLILGTTGGKIKFVSVLFLCHGSNENSLRILEKLLI